ncbi:MAG: ATP-grasp domain-containing protein [Clostridia bacterium]|nr:ATP-grasp domain-containing protein [Clostridia bacterium]
MKKLLIVGASILQLPAIQKAKEMGYYVGVIDFNPAAIGIPYADEYFNVSTIDIDGVCEVASRFKPDGIMTLATDMPMRSIAAATSVCRLPGISMDTAIKSTDKGEMIKAFQQYGVEHPWFYILKDKKELETVIDNITYPCISKPTDNSGSRGVMFIKDADELKAAVEYSSSCGRGGSVIVEEYLSGNEVSVEIIVLNGVVNVLQVTDKLTTGAPHFVETGHTQPSRLPKEDVEKIKDLASRAVKAVGIENGPAHVEIMLTENGPKMIELGARMGGDCITTHLVPLSTGVNMIKAVIQIACGETPDLEPKFQKGSAIRFIDAPYGTIAKIQGIEHAKEIPGVIEIAFTKQVGDKLEKIKSSTDRAGFVIAQADTAEEAISVCKQAINIIKIE